MPSVMTKKVKPVTVYRSAAARLKEKHGIDLSAVKVADEKKVDTKDKNIRGVA